MVTRHKYMAYFINWKVPNTMDLLVGFAGYKPFWWVLGIRILTRDPVVSTPRLACLSSLKRVKFSKGEIATFIWPWQSPLKSVMLYQPQINWKPDRSGERSTEAKPITLSSSVGEEKWDGVAGPGRLSEAGSGGWGSWGVPKPSPKTENKSIRDWLQSLLSFSVSHLRDRGEENEVRGEREDTIHWEPEPRESGPRIFLTFTHRILQEPLGILECGVYVCLSLTALVQCLKNSLIY